MLVSESTEKRVYSQAFWDASPVVAGYFTVSFVFGLMAVNQGFPAWLPVFMSLIVYAGASQFSFLSLTLVGAPVTTIVLTTFLINLRHMLMSVYMSNAFEGQNINKKSRLLYAFGLTDESFALHSSKLKSEEARPGYLTMFNVFCHFSWVMGSLIGAITALYVNDVAALKLDYALTAMMLFVLASLTNSTKKLFVGVVSVATICTLNLYMESYLNIFVATMVGCWAGTWKKISI